MDGGIASKTPADMAGVGRDSPVEIGRRLRLIRIAYGRIHGHPKGMSQADFCRTTGIGVSAWNNAETGDARIGVDNAIAVYKATGASLEYVYLGDTQYLPHGLLTEIVKAEKELGRKNPSNARHGPR